MLFPRLYVFLGLAVLPHPTLSAPLFDQSPAFDKRLTLPVCQTGPGSPGIANWQFAVNLFINMVADSAFKDFWVFGSWVTLAQSAAANGCAVGFSSKPGYNNDLFLDIGPVKAYWTTIVADCPIGNGVAGYQGINENTNFWAWVNVA